LYYVEKELKLSELRSQFSKLKLAPASSTPRFPDKKEADIERRLEEAFTAITNTQEVKHSFALRSWLF